MGIESVEQLLEWMRVNCYNDNYAIGDIFIYEGCGLEYRNGVWVWYHTEKGTRQDLEYFYTEQDAVTYALTMLRSDPNANRHMVGFLTDVTQFEELVAVLERRSVKYWNDVIPYSYDAPRDRIRVFVFGCDIHKVMDLKHKYCLDS